eukprot:1152316-Pelagomonas_calceolata.AAC.12
MRSIHHVVYASMDAHQTRWHSFCASAACVFSSVNKQQRETGARCEVVTCQGVVAWNRHRAQPLLIAWSSHNCWLQVSLPTQYNSKNQAPVGALSSALAKIQVRNELGVAVCCAPSILPLWHWHEKIPESKQRPRCFTPTV